MKARLLLIIAAVALLPLGWAGVQAQTYTPPEILYYKNNDSCLALVEKYLSGEYNYNQDSIKIDTCESSSTFLKWYARKTYLFRTEEYIFLPKPIPFDTSVTWESIDSNYKDIRDDFEAIEQKYGKYTIKRYYSEKIDSIHLLYQRFTIEFENYFLIDSIIYDFNNIDSVFGTGILYPPILVHVDYEIIYKEFDYKLQIIDNSLIIKRDIGHLNFSNIIIYNLFGQPLINDELFFDNSIAIIDISSLNNGLYFVLIDNNIFKLIICR